MNKIIEFLKKSGWTKQQLAKKMEYSYSQIRRLTSDAPSRNNITPHVLKMLEAVEKEWAQKQEKQFK